MSVLTLEARISAHLVDWAINKSPGQRCVCAIRRMSRTMGETCGSFVTCAVSKLQ